MAYLGKYKGTETVNADSLTIEVKRASTFEDIVAEVTVEETVEA